MSPARGGRKGRGEGGERGGFGKPRGTDEFLSKRFTAPGSLMASPPSRSRRPLRAGRIPPHLAQLWCGGSSPACLPSPASAFPVGVGGVMMMSGTFSRLSAMAGTALPPALLLTHVLKPAGARGGEGQDRRGRAVARGGCHAQEPAGRPCSGGQEGEPLLRGLLDVQALLEASAPQPPCWPGTAPSEAPSLRGQAAEGPRSEPRLLLQGGPRTCRSASTLLSETEKPPRGLGEASELPAFLPLLKLRETS